MKPAALHSARLRLTVRGAVQGVGFRPFIHRLATELALAGYVNNSSQGVFIEVEGSRAALEQFLLRLEAERPPHSRIQSLETVWLDPLGHDRFEIRSSETTGDKTALVLPDIATCADCLREIFDSTDRRYRYPFTNCTHCGPRFSIITALPYDRVNTTMASFPMCPPCRAEYEDPGHRRFHAQPNACPNCGPRLSFGHSGKELFAHHEALLAAANAIRDGQIVAVKGLGGFHLMVSARNEDAVRRLRERKHREEKPLALMFPSLTSVRAVCEVSPLEERLLRAAEAPIVLLRRLARLEFSDGESQVAESIAPCNPTLGVMLPYTPLHHLLLAELGVPVVATSGNLSDEPICTDESEAVERLRGIADVFLVHNRPIARHVDDSVVRVMLDRELVLRRARGYAPLPVTLQPDFRSPKSATVLAVGAHLKNTVALAVGPQVFISQHIGDLETEQAHAAFRRVIADFQTLYDATPAVIAADLHPDYLSTKCALARRLAIGRELGGGKCGPSDSESTAPNVVQVQHHVAHVLSCMAENELEPPVLGVAWDGTGLGLDGTIWGGEFFLVSEAAVERVARFRSFPLPGGDKAVREPRRTALGVLYELDPRGHKALLYRQQSLGDHFSAAELATLECMLERRVHSPLCSSVGRLFDAVAALAGLRQRVRFEGQAAMELEFALVGVRSIEAYPLPIADCQCPAAKTTGPQPCRGGSRDYKDAASVLDWAPMIEAIVADAQRGVPVGEISVKFHNALAEAIVEVAQQIGEKRVLLTGGCFQNRYLTERTVARLRDTGFRPYWHQRVPPNDGGIALGQVVAARRRTSGAITTSA